MIRIIENWGALPIQCPVESNLELHPGKFVTVGKTLSISDGFHNDGIVDDINSTQYRVNCAGSIGSGHLNCTKPGYEFSVHIFKNEKLIQDTVCAFSIDSFDNFSYKDLNTFEKQNVFQYKIKINKNKIEILNFNDCKFLPDQNSGELQIYFLYSKNIKESNCSTIIGSNRATVWNKPMIYSTDMFEFEKLLTYKKYQKLYVRNGLLTNEKWDVCLESVGFLIDIDSRFNMTVYKS